MAKNNYTRQIRQAIKEKYSVAARSVEGLFQDSTGKEGAKWLKYDQRFIDEAPKCHGGIVHLKKLHALFRKNYIEIVSCHCP